MEKTTPDPSPPTDLVVPTVIPAPRRLPTLALAPDATIGDWHHNFDLASAAGKAALVNASNVPDWQPGDGGSVTLEVTHYLCFPDEYQDRETGEILQATSLVFCGRDGRHAKFRSEWSLRRLHAMLMLYTPDEWARGIGIECFAAKSRRPGHTYGSFRVLGPTTGPGAA